MQFSRMTSVPATIAGLPQSPAMTSSKSTRALQEMVTEPRDAAIVRAIVSLAESLNSVLWPKAWKPPEQRDCPPATAATPGATCMAALGRLKTCVEMKGIQDEHIEPDPNPSCAARQFGKLEVLDFVKFVKSSVVVCHPLHPGTHPLPSDAGDALFQALTEVDFVAALKPDEQLSTHYPSSNSISRAYVRP